MSQIRSKAEAIVQVDNERVIVTEWKFLPGAETGWHRHGCDYIVVPGMKGKLLFETEGGDYLTELEAGQAYFRCSGVEHNVVNANDYAFSFVEVELK